MLAPVGEDGLIYGRHGERVLVQLSLHHFKELHLIVILHQLLILNRRAHEKAKDLRQGNSDGTVATAPGGEFLHTFGQL